MATYFFVLFCFKFGLLSIVRIPPKKANCWLYNKHLLFSQFSHIQLSDSPWTAAHQASLSLTISRSLLRLMPTESMMPSNHLILCHPLLLLPSTFLSIRVFSSELALLVRWPKYWSFSISPSNEYSVLISFRIDWFDLLVIQGILKSFLQHHSSKLSILWSSTLLCGPAVTCVHDYWKNHSFD